MTFNLFSTFFILRITFQKNILIKGIELNATGDEDKPPTREILASSPRSVPHERAPAISKPETSMATHPKLPSYIEEQLDQNYQNLLRSLFSTRKTTEYRPDQAQKIKEMPPAVPMPTATGTHQIPVVRRRKQKKK